MLLSRFWYVLLSLALGATIFVLYLAAAMYDRAGARTMREALSSDAQVVSWYLQDDARRRSAELIKFALDSDVQKQLDKSTKSLTVPQAARDAIQTALTKVNGTVHEESSFDAVFAVDQHGRVVGHLGYELARGMENFELGGYPVVADALHGYIRDDTLVLDRVYRVVARPVEYEVGAMPAGAIIGARVVDDKFARELSERTGAAVAFYTSGQRIASGAPDGFDRSLLDQVRADMKNVETEATYIEKGRSGVRIVAGNMGLVYSRMPGEAYALGAGFAVARLPAQVGSPYGFFKAADDTDKANVNVWMVIGIAVGAAGLGLVFTFLEHTRPLLALRREAHRFGKGETDQILPSKLSGVLRKVASDIADGMDHVVAKGGGTRRAADLKQVLGDLPAQPQMSAFALPPTQEAGVEDAVPSTPASGVATPKPRSLPKPPPGAGKAGPPRPPKPGRPEEVSGSTALPGSGDAPPDDADQDQLSEWRGVYEEFVATKQQCGESIEGFTYEKFEQTLKKNEATLVQRHGAKRVKFSVYVKEGKAALKANPIRA